MDREGKGGRGEEGRENGRKKEGKSEKEKVKPRAPATFRTIDLV